LNSDTAKSLSVKKLIAKAYPVISATTKDADLTLKIENPKDNNEDFEIVGFKVDGKITSASFNDSSIAFADLANLNTIINNKQVSLADGDSTELVLSAKKNSTVQVTAIIIRIGTNCVEISSDYTNVGKWTNFKVSAGDKGSDDYKEVTAITGCPVPGSSSSSSSSTPTTKYNYFTLTIPTANTAALAA
jgi:hypothetical protein